MMLSAGIVRHGLVGRKELKRVGRSTCVNKTVA